MNGLERRIFSSVWKFRNWKSTLNLTSMDVQSLRCKCTDTPPLRYRSRSTSDNPFLHGTWSQVALVSQVELILFTKSVVFRNFVTCSLTDIQIATFNTMKLFGTIIGLWLNYLILKGSKFHAHQLTGNEQENINDYYIYRCYSFTCGGWFCLQSVNPLEFCILSWSFDLVDRFWDFWYRLAH
jgi:hypothetical protein